MALKTGRLWLFSLLSLLVLLAGCAAPGSGSPRSIWIPGWGWEGLVGLALAIVGLILALSYMAATLLGDEQLKAWTKKEAGQLGYSAIILIVAIALVGNLEGWVKLISTVASPSTAWHNYVNIVVCCDPATTSCLQSPALARSRPCHIALASDYLQALYESARLQAYSHLLNTGEYALLSNLTIGASLTMLIDLGNFNFRPFSFLALNSEFYSVLFDLTFKTMMFIRVQQMMLEYLWLAFFPFMLSAGIVLRAFHFTRKLGGLMIALGLATYIALPMFYVLLNGIMFGFMGGGGVVGTWNYNGKAFGNTFNQTKTILPGSDQADPNRDFGVLPPSGDAFANPPLDVMDICGENPTAPGEADQISLVETLQKQFGRALYGNWMEAEEAADTGSDGRFGTQGPVANLAMLMVFTLINPFIALMTALAAFKYLSPLIGGDFEISILSRLI